MTLECTLFIPRTFLLKSAATRGARFLGYRGTLEFDWYTNQLKIFRHQTDRTDTYEFTGESSHFGGDEFLARSFMEMVYQKKPLRSAFAGWYFKRANVPGCQKILPGGIVSSRFRIFKQGFPLRRVK